MTEVVKAAHLLAAQGVNVDVYSVTSWSELARDGRACQNRQMAGDATAPMPFIAQQLQGSAGQKWPRKFEQFLSGNSGYQSEPESVGHEGAFNGQEISTLYPAHAYTSIQSQGGAGSFA